MSPEASRGKIRKWIVALIGVLVGVRVLAMIFIPLMDTTEARYGEISRKMAVLNDWVTPWAEWGFNGLHRFKLAVPPADAPWALWGFPFWAKPPLPFWVSAVSVDLFGVSEFSLRLPHLLCGALVCWLAYRFAKAVMGERAAFLSTAVLCGTGGFVLAIGAVMTDTVLIFTTFWITLSFWGALHAKDPATRRRHAWLFFVAAGLGLVAKGPVSWVLPGMGFVVWTAVERRWRDMWTELPWVRGILLALLIGAPWYVAAELRTPGFIDYFIIGEHIHRFLTPGWKGDLYGHAHEFMPGTIWLFTIAALMPWIVLLPIAAFVWRKNPKPTVNDRSLGLYLGLSAILPLIFFTAARNIIWTYTLPSVPILCLLMGRWLARRSLTSERWVAAGLAILIVGSSYGFGQIFIGNKLELRSARDLAQRFDALAGPQEPLLYATERPFSANFYSAGRAVEFKTLAEILPMLGANGGYLVVRPEQISELPGAGLELVQNIGQFGKDDLLKVRAVHAGALDARPAVAAN